MRTFLLALAAILIIALASFAQPPVTMWTHAYGATGPDEADGICAISSGGFYVAGRTRSFSPQPDVWLLRIDDLGDTVWTRTFGGSSTDYASAVCESEDGGAIVVGSTESFGAGLADIYLIRTDDQGDTLWTRTYGTSGFDFAYGITRTFDGGYVVCGSTGTPSQSLNMLLLRFSATNELQWSRDYGGSNVDEAFALRQTADGGFVLAGRSVPPSGSVPDMYVVRVTATGDTLWTRRYSDGDWEEATGILETVDGGYLVSGWKYVTGSDPSDFHIIKTGVTGAAQWTHDFGGDSYDRATAVQQATDGGYIVGGITSSYGAGDHDFYFVKLTTTGDTVWTRTNGGPGSDNLYGLAIAHDGGYIAAGTTTSTGSGSTDGWVVRLPGFSGIGGIVRDLVTNQPLANVSIGAVGQAHHVVSDIVGHYVLTFPPDASYSIITSGPCVGRDTVEAISVFQDSISTLDISVGVPHSTVPQTSVNIVAYNRVATHDTLRIYNTGFGVLDMRVTTSTVTPGGAWLTVDPAVTQIEPGDSGWVAVTVTSDTTDTGVFDYYGFLVLHSNSCPDSAQRLDVIATILDAEDRPARVPRQYSLSAFPNPFNPTTSLLFTLEREELVTLTVFDVTGRETQILVDGTLAAGEHHVEFDGSSLPSGLYFAHLQTPNATLTQKLLLVK